MKSVWLCQEANADVLGYRAAGHLDLATGASGRTLQGGQGRPWWVLLSAGDGGKPRGSSALLKTPFPEFCRGVNTSQSHPMSWVLSPIGV